MALKLYTLICQFFCFKVFFKFGVKQFFYVLLFFSGNEYGGCKSNLHAFGCNLRDAK